MALTGCGTSSTNGSRWRAWIGPPKQSGIIGEPEHASAEAGKAFFEAIVGAVSEHVGRLQRGDFTDYYSQPRS